MEIEKTELNGLESLQESIMSKNKETNESKNTISDDLFGKMVAEDLKVIPPLSKLQARNEIQNVLFKYHMAAMQDSLQRNFNSTAVVDHNFSPIKTRKTQSSNNLRNNLQAKNSNTNSSGGSHQYNHQYGINMSTSSKLNKFILYKEINHTLMNKCIFYLSFPVLLAYRSCHSTASLSLLILSFKPFLLSLDNLL